MTHNDELKTAVALIREECKQHGMCSECPLCSIVCHKGINYPATWPAEKIGVDDVE